MLKRGAITVSMFSSSTVLAGGRKRLRRRRVSTIRLGNKRRGFCLVSRPVIRWGVMVAPLRMLKSILMDMAPNGRFIEAYYLSLPFLRPQIFPLCWLFWCLISFFSLASVVKSVLDSKIIVLFIFNVFIGDMSVQPTPIAAYMIWNSWYIIIEYRRAGNLNEVAEVKKYFA